jgi:hypothetical protein
VLADSIVFAQVVDVSESGIKNPARPETNITASPASTLTT